MKKSILILFVALLSATTYAQTAAKRTSEFNLEKKVAIQGYDPVAYFTQKKAVKGKSNIASSYEGVIYYFSSQTNKDAFSKSQQVSNHNTVDGARMRWERRARK